MDVDIKRVEEFFFKAMLRGWAGNGKYIEIFGRAGYKRFVFSDGDFHLVDEYCVNAESKKSFGTTTIWFRNIPVWVMTYGGWYEKWAIDFVKKALLEAYQAGIFMGGRGPTKFYPGGELIYVNHIGLNSFGDFSGLERVSGGRKQHPGEEGGYHQYWGVSLI